MHSPGNGEDGLLARLENPVKAGCDRYTIAGACGLPAEACRSPRTIRSTTWVPKKVVESALCPDPDDVDEEEWKCGSPAIGDRRVILARQGLRHGESHCEGL